MQWLTSNYNEYATQPKSLFWGTCADWIEDKLH